MSSINLPKGRSLADEYARTLTAQANIMPNLLAAQAQYQPLQSSNQLANLNYMLMGTPDYNYDVQEYVPAVYKQGKKYSYGKIPQGVQGTIRYPDLPDPRGGGGGRNGGIPGLSSIGMPGLMGPGSDGSLPGMPKLPGIGGGGDFLSKIPGVGGMFGGGDKPKKKLVSGSRYITTTKHAPAQRGLLDIYVNDVMPKMSGGIIPELTDQANHELVMGASLDPSSMRNITQMLRSRQAGMLGGTGTAGDFNEALGLSAYGDQVRQLRRQFAQNVANMRMASNPVSQALGLTTMPGATSLLNPESGYAGDIYSGNWNAAVGKSISDAKMTNDLIGAGISSFGNLAGGALAGGM